jgi:hypothetical protein
MYALYFVRKSCEPLVKGNVLIYIYTFFCCHVYLQFYLKLEEKHQAMEEEKIQLEAKMKVISLAVIVFPLSCICILLCLSVSPLRCSDGLVLKTSLPFHYAKT